jgi:hypothetical protein
VSGGGGDEAAYQLPKMMMCSRCRTVHYCSRECQKAHWGDHKGQCRKR